MIVVGVGGEQLEAVEVLALQLREGAMDALREGEGQEKGIVIGVTYPIRNEMDVERTRTAHRLGVATEPHPSDFAKLDKDGRACPRGLLLDELDIVIPHIDVLKVVGDVNS